MDLASREADRISTLVQEGALPQARLAQAQAQLADAHDDVILQRTLYGVTTVQMLTEPQAEEMIAAAQRRVDRQKARIEDTQNLIAQGIVARNALDALNQELNMRETTLQLAQSRAQLLKDLIATAHTESLAASGPGSFSGIEEHFAGKGSLSTADVHAIEIAYTKKFSHPLPISAFGETAVHRALGFDHRGRVDVALSPDQQEGLWLRQYLEAKNIPFYAFRAAIPGKATGAHIHIGPGSTRLRTNKAAIEAD